MPGVPSHIRDILTRLHKSSSTQEATVTKDQWKDTKNFDAIMRDKFIALDEDKAQAVYQICRAINAQTIVEAGTSFGVSTIYLALAASANAKATATAGKPKVIATENEPTKAAKAREHWHECGELVNGVIELREGDLRGTLTSDIDSVDFLLLDSTLRFCPFAVVSKCCALTTAC
jgi:predicted O-methyltransferase YrrM